MITGSACMVRWFKLFDHQYFGFWVLGLVLFAIQEIPYMVMPVFHLETNPIMNIVETSAALDVVHEEAVVFSVAEGRERLFFAVAMGVLLLNFLGWGLYFGGHQSVFVMMLFIVVMPPLYYVAIGLWRRNVLLAAVGAVFLVVHFVHVYGNLKA